MIDRTTKILLALIAAGLWANAAAPAVRTAKADADYYFPISEIARSLSSIASSIDNLASAVRSHN